MSISFSVSANGTAQHFLHDGVLAVLGKFSHVGFDPVEAGVYFTYVGRYGVGHSGAAVYDALFGGGELGVAFGRLEAVYPIKGRVDEAQHRLARKVAGVQQLCKERHVKFGVDALKGVSVGFHLGGETVAYFCVEAHNVLVVAAGNGGGDGAMAAAMVS